MKYVPNCITITRIFAAVCLLLVKPFSEVFFFFYLICGISDVLDGYIARRMNVTSKAGQVLDSISDLIFIMISLSIFIPIMKFPLWIIFWVFIIAAIRVMSIVFAFAKYRRLAFLHTYANKATGTILFLFPFLFMVLGKEITAIIICCIASISAAEELLINLTSKILDRDIESIFRK